MRRATHWFSIVFTGTRSSGSSAASFGSGLTVTWCCTSSGGGSVSSVDWTSPVSSPSPSERSSPSWSESRRLRLIRNRFARRAVMHLLRADRLTVTRARGRLRQSPRCEARLSRLVYCFTVLVLSYSRNVAVASWAFFWSCRVQRSWS